jgi:hypothetical protein
VQDGLPEKTLPELTWTLIAGAEFQFNH